jgi:hypothetical protein
MYSLTYIAWCLIQHSLFAVLWASPVLLWISIIWSRGCRETRTYLSLSLLGVALAVTSHWAADAAGLWF